MAMAFTYNSPPRMQLRINPHSTRSFPGAILSSPLRQTTSLRRIICALKTGSDGGKLRNQDAFGPELLRKPIISSAVDTGDEAAKDLTGITDDEEGNRGKRRYEERGEAEPVDWEDRILEDTVPLVGFARMILHSGKYESGDRLSPEHEKTVIESLLQHHPECEQKIGCGIDYITIGYHPEFESSRCLFIVRKDGELVDFSYWKCIKGLIRKNYPLYADTFILRHFRRRRGG